MECSLEVSQIRAMRLYKYGIDKVAFVNLMRNFEALYEDVKQKTLLTFDTKKYERIFDMFDDQGCGSLDFREFLTCFSVLLRGSFSQKLELFFTAFGSKQHKYLNKNEFEILMDILFRSYMT